MLVAGILAKLLSFIGAEGNFFTFNGYAHSNFSRSKIFETKTAKDFFISRFNCFKLAHPDF